MDKNTKQQATDLVNSFMEKGMISSWRNKAGNMFWPSVKKVFQGVMIGSTVLLFSSPASTLALMGGCFAAERLLTSHIKFLQNMTLSNAARFGRSMMEKHTPEVVRQAAMERFLSKASPWFTASKYIRQNPEKVCALRDGKTVPRLVSLSDIVERRMNRAVRMAEQRGDTRPSFKERFQVYRDSFKEFQQTRKEQSNQSPLISALNRVSIASNPFVVPAATYSPKRMITSPHKIDPLIALAQKDSSRPH